MLYSDRHQRDVLQMIIERARRRFSDAVVDHWLHPRNNRAMDRPEGHARITGPCGETMEIYLRVHKGRIADASFLTDGCLTSIAAGSMAVSMAKGKDLPAAREISQEAILSGLGGLPEGVRHCALLASRTLQAAMDDCRNRGEGARGV
jgi:nitrogen fixation NifU-like protein